MSEQQQLEEIKRIVTNLDAKVSGIISVLRGNELDKGDTGISGRVNDLEDRVFDLEKWKYRIFWFGLGMAAPAGVGVWELLKVLFK